MINAATKADENDAATLAYYLMKEMLPESHLCSQTSEEIRRLLKTRSVLVQSMVKIKNQIHGMMLGYGIETKAAQFQSKRKRQELINDDKGSGRAIIALARKITRIVFVMLSKREQLDTDLCAKLFDTFTSLDYNELESWNFRLSLIGRF